jgi:hypothetical protein
MSLQNIRKALKALENIDNPEILDDYAKKLIHEFEEKGR